MMCMEMPSVHLDDFQNPLQNSPRYWKIRWIVTRLPLRTVPSSPSRQQQVNISDKRDGSIGRTPTKPAINFWGIHLSLKFEL